MGNAHGRGNTGRTTEVQQLANTIYNRVGLAVMLTNGGKLPKKRRLPMGWKPESGFLTNNWDRYDELMYLYLLGLGRKSRCPTPPGKPGRVLSSSMQDSIPSWAADLHARDAAGVLQFPQSA